MKYVYVTLNWAFGVLFVLAALAIALSSLSAALCYFIIGLLLLPPVRTFVYSKTNAALPTKVRGVAIAVLFFGAAFATSLDAQKEIEIAQAKEAAEKAELAKKVREEQIVYFNANQAEIIEKVSSALAEKNYQEAISESQNYLGSGNKELKRLNTKAREKLQILKNEEQTQNILVQLKDIPAKEYARNRDLYQQLVKLNPSNDAYKTKFNTYKKKAEEEQAKLAAAEKRKETIQSQFSSWDGSHMQLARAIKKSMHDPDSYDHDETVYWDMGDHLIVQTTYRGKNGFGAVVRNRLKAKVSLDGQVLSVLDQN